MALAAKHKGEDRKAIAIIGDGAMSAGMAFEAMNNAGVADTDMLVILNDNEMSISPPVGALNNILTRLTSSKTYNAAREAGRHMLGFAPPLLELARRAEEHVKGMIAPGTLFEEFGFHYYGPIDGHDLDALIPTLENLKKLKGPKFLHVITKKGQGYKLAENDPILYHGVGKFAACDGIQSSKGPAKLTYTQVFGDWLCDMAKADSRLIGVTPAMREGSGMVRFSAEHADRYFDVGIAEQHAVTFAAGLACEACRRHLFDLPATWLRPIGSRCRASEAAGHVCSRPRRTGWRRWPTHHGTFDLSFVTCIPNMVVMAPSDEAECRQMLSTAYSLDCPSMVRYPRGGGTGKVPAENLETLPVGKGEIRRQGKDVAILAFGSLVTAAIAAGDELDATVANMRFIKPLDVDLIVELAGNHSLLVSIEENAVIGGAGSEIERVLAERGVQVQFLRLGLPDRFIDHGEQGQLLAELGLDKVGIVRAIQHRLGGQTNPQ
jgi:1-deoxy-D-xylulose-5-phosphate synthase